MTILLKAMKQIVLKKYNTYLHMEQCGYRDVLVLASAYEYAGTGLNVENGTYYDEELSNRIRRVVNDFWCKAIGFDAKRKRFVAKGMNEKEFKHYKHSFDAFVLRKYANDLEQMTKTIKMFLFQDYDVSDEEIIKSSRIDIEFDKGVFMVEALAFGGMRGFG